ncbi:MAG: filamentous hemagglutinin N-terminal domain-containing protein [Phormidesmis sp.]
MPTSRFLLFCLLTSLNTLFASPTQAQINPDQTLGVESSIVTPNTEVNGEQVDLIEGGAARGSNLFHSFSDFNIPAAEQVYFANPVGIESILSRVTGDNLSHIFGVLGVDGNADLLLINPNGIIFGSEAVLDVEGSFYATTSEAVAIGEGIYSATNPDQSQLLAIKPDASFLNYLTSASGDIVSRGRLSVGEDFSLAANNLDLQGQLVTGGALSLLAADILQIRDTVETPFVAYSGGNLLIQGNQQVDIVALSHPESGLFSGGDMVLRSPHQIGGDAHYSSGGNFRIEQLNGALGKLFSPKDPVIIADGDISFNSYIGASLHLLAGGSIFIPSITITDKDVSETSLTQTVVLSDGTPLSISGSDRATLDLRAGIDWTQIFEEPPGNLTFGVSVDSEFFGDSATSSGIAVGNIDIEQPGGLIFMSNQFLPNHALPASPISIFGNVDAAGNGGDGSSIVIDAIEDIVIQPLIGDGIINASSNTSNSGDIKLLAQGSVSMLGSSSEDTANLLSNLDFGATGSTGTITVDAESLTLLNAQISNSIFGTGDAKLIKINVSGDVSLENSQIFSTIAFNGAGDSSGITINSGSLSMLGSQILTIVRGPDFGFPAGAGNAGDINLNVAGDISLTGSALEESEEGLVVSAGIASALAPESSGSSGNITINADRLLLNASGSISSAIDRDAAGKSGNIVLNLNNLELNNRSSISSNTAGQGDAGEIDINVTEAMSITDESVVTNSVIFGAVGDAGQININAKDLTVASGATIQSSVFQSVNGLPAGIGNAGSITLEVGDRLLITGQQAGLRSAIATDLGRDTEGVGRNISIQAGSLEIGDGARLNARTQASGQAGNIQIEADSVLIFNDGGITSATSSSGNAGNIQLDVASLEINDGAFILTDALTGASGQGGQLIVNASDSIEIRGVSLVDLAAGIEPDSSGLYAQTRSTNRAGDIILNTNWLTVADGGSVSTETSGQGEGGDIVVNAGPVLITGGSPSESFSSSFNAGAETGSSGNAGNIIFNAQSILASEGGFIASSAKSGSSGNAGSVSITVDDLIEVVGRTSDGDAATAISVGVALGASGNAGNIFIDTGSISVRDGGGVFAQTFGTGQPGSIRIMARDMVEVVSRDGDISLINSSIGPDAGNALSTIDIQTRALRLEGGGQIASNTFGAGDAGDILVLASDSVDIIGITSDGFFPSGILARSIPTVQEQVRSDGGLETIFIPATGRGGDVALETGLLRVSDGGVISSETFGPSDAGNIAVSVDRLRMRDGSISTASTQGSGGGIQIRADSAQLFGDSDITTFVAEGTGSGGDISIDADALIAFDDSDILAFAADGRGGNIDFGRTAFFGQNVQVAAPNIDPRTLDSNSQVDINARGGLSSGNIVLSDVSFVENGLIELAASLVNPETLIANSCIARGNDTATTFTGVGSEGLPQTPEAALSNSYAVGTIQLIPTDTDEVGAIAEPQSTYRLADGRLVMSQLCE